MRRRKGALGVGERAEMFGEISSTRSEADVELVTEAGEARMERTSPDPIWPLVLWIISKFVSK